MKAFLFPGQGSQFPGMGRYLFDNFQLVPPLFEEASEALKLDMKKLCFESTESELALTANTQPAILLVSVATQRAIQHEFDLKPDFVAGHSIGEYSALVTAKVLPFAFAMQAVRRRGEAMQSAVPVGQGGMVVTLGLDESQVEFLCAEVEKNSGFRPLSPANFNCPGQIVLSGSAKAIEWLHKNFKPENLPGAPKRPKLISLNVSAPFHCSLMAPAENAMAEFLAPIEFAKAECPVVQNFNGKEETAGAAIKAHLIRQISSPVLWTQSIEKLQTLGVHTLVECGAGRVVSGLVKKISGENMKIYSTNSLEEFKLLEQLL